VGNEKAHGKMEISRQRSSAKSVGARSGYASHANSRSFELLEPVSVFSIVPTFVRLMGVNRGRR